MKTKYLIVIMLTSFTLAAEKDGPVKDYAMYQDDKLSVESIYGIKLCPELVPLLNLNKNDEEYAARLDPKIISRLENYVNTRKIEESKLVHARRIGEFILVFYTQQKDDGGFELVYSLKEEKVLGIFMGDYRG